MTWHPDIPEEYRNQIVTGDARELAKRIPNESIDLIFTDPVYDRIEDYEWLAETAMGTLKPAGVLLCWSNGRWHYKNARWLDDAGLNYRWEFSHLWRTGAAMVGKIISKTNRLIWMDKHGESKIRDYLCDGYVTKPWSKIGSHNHKWTKDLRYCQQSIRAFSAIGDIVFDPFCGGATIQAACKLEGRNYIAFEIDPDTAEMARERVLNTQPPLFVPEPEQLELCNTQEEHQDVACAKCGELIDGCECEDGFFLKGGEDETE